MLGKSPQLAPPVGGNLQSVVYNVAANPEHLFRREYFNYSTSQSPSVRPSVSEAASSSQRGSPSCVRLGPLSYPGKQDLVVEGEEGERRGSLLRRSPGEGRGNSSWPPSVVSRRRTLETVLGRVPGATEKSRGPVHEGQLKNRGNTLQDRPWRSRATILPASLCPHQGITTPDPPTALAGKIGMQREQINQGLSSRKTSNKPHQGRVGFCFMSAQFNVFRRGPTFFNGSPTGDPPGH